MNRRLSNSCGYLRDRIVAVAVVALVASSHIAGAQPESRINGVVRDATGAGIPGVTVTATHLAAKASHTATTGTDGAYSLPVQSGTYSVSAAVLGFRRVVQQVDVPAGAPTPLDFLLDAKLIEEVAVTASKREQTILDVPFSVAAPTEEMLRRRGVDDIEGVAANVAGFTVQNLGPGQSQVAMRGVSAGQIVRDQPGVKEQVGVYLDESVISLSLFTPDLDLFDTKRVEVLRGPQGTLFGSGSLTGTVRYITNQPELGVTKAFAELRLAWRRTAAAPAATPSSASTCRSATRPRCASRRTTTGSPASSTPCSRTSRCKENVNDGDRTGVRRRRAVRAERPAHHHAAHRLPAGRDGRLEPHRRLQHPRQSVHHHAAGGHARRPRAVHADRRGVHRRLRARRPQPRLRLRRRLPLTSITSYTYRDVLVVRDAGALTVEHHRRQHRPAETSTRSTRRSTTPPRPSVWTQELRLAGGARPHPWVAGGVLQPHGPRLRPEPAGRRVRRPRPASRRAGLRAPKDTLFFSDLGYELDSVRALRRSHRARRPTSSA